MARAGWLVLARPSKEGADESGRAVNYELSEV